MATLSVIIASTRPGRAGEAVGRWFVEHARAHGAFDVNVVDLAELNLPFLDESQHPRFRRYEKAHTLAWSARVEASDAFVFVTPEYNYGYPASLKNAIDFLHQEWRHKPVAFVSYGGVAAGTRAVQQLKQVVTALSMMPINEAVAIPFFTQFIVDGKVEPNETMVQAAGALLDELARVEVAMRPLRAAPAGR
jgi:NAD(P)H-dependent FMN reductase